MVDRPDGEAHPQTQAAARGVFMSEENPFMTTSAAMEFLGVRPTTFWKILKDNEGSSRPHRLGRKCLWDRAELQAWVKAQPKFIRSYTADE
jgi:predicted DNA-binding transcriptional regulator AlpA